MLTLLLLVVIAALVFDFICSCRGFAPTARWAYPRALSGFALSGWAGQRVAASAAPIICRPHPAAPEVPIC
jgi:hypothetical protein